MLNQNWKVDHMTKREMIQQAVDHFWETIPAFWAGVRAYIRQAAVEGGEISVEQFQLMRHIRQGLTSVSQLAEVKRISRSAISQGVNSLVEKGLIDRQHSPHDRRQIELTLTAAGNRLLDAIFEDTRRWMRRMFSSLDQKELDGLIQAFTALRSIPRS
jgi:DNA-binding MarR family transcriptional regulator